LPNVITLPGALLGLGLAFFDPRVAWMDAFLGGVIGGGLLYFVAWAYLKLRGREGMGMGDVKMMLLVGAFLGWQGALMTIFIGSLLGSIVGVAMISMSRKGWEYALPFGTFLAAAGVLVAFRGPQIFAWYWGMFAVTG
jgi:leader peptidase (prepilin peptidase)/N-methyltransferase